LTKHEFIFSDQRWHRVTRHVIFWLLWCLAFNILFHFPIHVFKGWNEGAAGNANLKQLGLGLFFVKTLLVNSFFGVIVPQIALTYVLLYWLLPNYFFKKKNPLVTTSVIIGVLIAFVVTAILFKHSPVLYIWLAGMGTTSYVFSVMPHAVTIDQLTTLPIVLGFAVMIKLIKRWRLKQKEIEQLAKEKTKAELQLLKAQVHPHFLFNTLNNIYFFTLTNSIQAPEMIKKLSGMLHYILNECDRPQVPLEKEIKMIRDYMALEKIRYGDQLQMTIDIQENNNNEKMIAPLLLIPFVENSFKHGASKMITHPWVKLRITIENNRLHFIIMNSVPAITEATHSKGNIGLKNVRKRLELLYPDSHELNIASESVSYAVYLNIELQAINKMPLSTNNEIKQAGDYAMV
jgi:sensor histidine kinase YesM